jgi:hypothetical protein
LPSPSYVPERSLFFNGILNVGDLFDFNVAEGVSFYALIHMVPGHLNVSVVLRVCESVRAAYCDVEVGDSLTVFIVYSV